MPRYVTDETYFTESLKTGIIFAWVFFLFILSWISVAVVGRAIDNLSFVTLGLNDKSTLHTFVIAFVVISIELVTLYYFYSMGMNIYDTSFMGDFSMQCDDNKNDYNMNSVYLLNNGKGLSSINYLDNITII